MYPDRPWDKQHTHSDHLVAKKNASQRKKTPPAGTTFEGIHAVTDWIQHNAWTVRHDEYQKRPFNSNILHYLCTYVEAAIAFEAQTRIALGGPKTDLHDKAKLLQIILRSVHSTCDIRRRGDTRKTTYAQLFDPRHVRSARDIAGVWLSRVSRRPIWTDGQAIEELIAFNLALARQQFDDQYGDDHNLAIKKRGDNFGRDFQLKIK